jgi:ribosomal protein S18 acetylase RimI-like enzyme
MTSRPPEATLRCIGIDDDYLAGQTDKLTVCARIVPYGSMAAMLTVRPVESPDLPVVWALSVLPNIGETADLSVAFPLPPAEVMPADAFDDLADPEKTFTAAGGELVIGELDGHVAAMGGFRPVAEMPGRVEILRVRVHPARRRLGLGRAIMNALEATAFARGYREAWLDTATNQPEAMAFYRSLGYQETSRESRSDWRWTLVIYRKDLKS